jgi:trk system potassium uptake protein
MYIIIVGCGSLGVELASGLSLDGHNVTMVDSDPAAFNSLGGDFDGMTITGDGTQVDTLKSAGCEEADALAAVTSDDNTNITVAQVASAILGIPRVVARVFDPQRETVFKEFGLPTVCPTIEGTREIRAFLLTGMLHRRLSCGAGEVSIYSLPVGDNLNGRRISDIEVPQKLRVVALEHEGVAHIPVGEESLHDGDTLTVAVRIDALGLMSELARSEGGRK